jgi:hypothetical protein
MSEAKPPDAPPQTAPETALVPVSPMLRQHGARPIPLVSRFLLPLVKGGPLHVGRPIGPRAIGALAAAWRMGARRPFTSVEDMAEEDAVAELTRLRQGRARAFLFSASAPPLDETSLRLGVAVHNLLALGHPGLARRGLERRQERIVDASLPIAELGPPQTAEEAVRRHSLLARLGEITRTEHTVEYWAGRRRYVGRQPPSHLLALPRVRRVSTTSVRRLWFKEIGVPQCGRPLWIALHRASPLGEALDPLRLEPPLAWERVLPVLRFPALARAVAGRLLEIGLEGVGTALVAALLRFASLRESAGVTPAGAAFAIRFLAHLFWLQHLYGGDELTANGDLVALLLSAADIDPRLVFPPDAPAGAPVGADLRERLARLRATAELPPDRQTALAAVCRFAVQGAP